jgi:HSP20 family protein
MRARKIARMATWREKERIMNMIRQKQKNAMARRGQMKREEFPMVVQRMRDELNELFEQFSHGFTTWNPTSGKGWNWGLDVDEKEDRVEIHAEAPGFEPDDFDIRVTGNRLILQAAHRTSGKEKGHEFEESQECFESVALPDGIDASKVDACYHNGMLTVTIPKTSAGRGQRITVKPS